MDVPVTPDPTDPAGSQAKPESSDPIERMEQRSDRNLALWRLNETTDPGHTKPVKLGRSFTAIDAYYQIKRATETFGPIGDGWGWQLEEAVERVELVAKDGPSTVAFAKCRVTLWYRAEDGVVCYCGPVVATNQLVSKSGGVDDDAFKKATTDAVTKALSYLGFSADVFMGLFDDNKYVANLREQHNRKVTATGSQLPQMCTAALAKLPGINDLADLTIMWKSITTDLKGLSPAQLDFMKNRFAMRKRQLAPSEDPPPQQDGNAE